MENEKPLTLPLSAGYKAIKSNGVRCSKEAAQHLIVKAIEYIKTESKNAADKAIAAGRKTVQVEDFS